MGKAKRAKGSGALFWPPWVLSIVVCTHPRKHSCTQSKSRSKQWKSRRLIWMFFSVTSWLTQRMGGLSPSAQGDGDPGCEAILSHKQRGSLEFPVTARKRARYKRPHIHLEETPRTELEGSGALTGS